MTTTEGLKSRPWYCGNCAIEVGGYFGNKVYGDIKLKLCKACIEQNDPLTQLCIKMTGMTPSVYQQTYGRAWNA